MKRRVHYARHFRQLKYHSKRINRLIQSGRFRELSEKKQEDLLYRLRYLYKRLRGVIAGNKLRKAIAGAALVLGLGYAPQVQAQTFGPLQTNPFGLATPSDVNLVQAFDLDNDGDLDLLGASYLDYGGGVFYYYENSGTPDAPAFGNPVENPFGLSPGNEMTVLTAGDLDNDGDLDLLVGNYYDGGMSYYENTGTAEAPAFAAPVDGPFDIQPFYGISTPVFGDLDGDGDLDLVVGDYSGVLHFLENSGTPESPVFEDPEMGAFGLQGSPFVLIPHLADVDNDGDLDVFFGDIDILNYTYSIAFQENAGTPTSPAFIEVEMNPFDMAAPPNLPVLSSGDFDADGDLDMLAGAVYGAFQYYENLSAVPAAADAQVTMQEDTEYAFVESDFNFDDSSGDVLGVVKLLSLPLAGELTLNTVPVVENQEIPAADIPTLVFTPLPDEFGNPYASFQFKVSNEDGIFSSDDYLMTIVVTDVTSTASVELEGSFRLSPNPTTDQLFLSADLGTQPGFVELEVRNMLGQLIQTQSLGAQSGIRESVDVSSLPAGTYLLSIRTDSGLKSLRFQKI
ncbi:MAG: T9SS type A sorting domain-containing protein [Bacteroidetes bacterium]|nr:T9SS type A sorting domain-containing protein [Bacteroidota bacterium]